MKRLNSNMILDIKMFDSSLCTCFSEWTNGQNSMQLIDLFRISLKLISNSFIHMVFGAYLSNKCDLGNSNALQMSSALFMLNIVRAWREENTSLQLEYQLNFRMINKS